MKQYKVTLMDKFSNKFKLSVLGWMKPTVDSTIFYNGCDAPCGEYKVIDVE